MTGYSVTLDSAGDGHVDDDLIEDLLDALASHSASTSGGADRYSATISVDADDIHKAASTALRVYRSAARKVGLPDWPVVGLAVMTEAELEAELARPLLPPMVGVTEVAKMLEVSRQRVDSLRKRDDFPTPLATLAAGPIWNRHAVERFNDGWVRKSGRPRKEVGEAAERRRLAEAELHAASDAGDKERFKVAKAAYDEADREFHAVAGMPMPHRVGQ